MTCHTFKSDKNVEVVKTKTMDVKIAVTSVIPLDKHSWILRDTTSLLHNMIYALIIGLINLMGYKACVLERLNIYNNDWICMKITCIKILNNVIEQ